MKEDLGTLSRTNFELNWKHDETEVINEYEHLQEPVLDQLNEKVRALAREEWVLEKSYFRPSWKRAEKKRGGDPISSKTA